MFKRLSTLRTNSTKLVPGATCFSNEFVIGMKYFCRGSIMVGGPKHPYITWQCLHKHADLDEALTCAKQMRDECQ